jgi:low temperature requirement protein LtrA
MNEQAKRVSWVELYLDLVFVLAVGQIAHVIADRPVTHSVWIALGLFLTLWWTWIGFAVLYNRHGDDTPAQRLFFLAGSVPAGVAAVAIGPASTGDAAVLAASLAVIRLVIAAGYAAGSERGDALRRRITQACLISAVLFGVSVAISGPLRYVLWAAGIVIESSAALDEDRRAMHRARRQHNLAVLAPEDPAHALEAHHFAERFGLFLIILLGEVVVEAGQGSLEGGTPTASGWAALAAAMVIAASLWWIYFDSVADINLKVLQLSGGSPSMARALFAVGHMVPAFALLLTASGIGLLLEHDPPRAAFWLPCVGLGMYLAGTRALFLSGNRLSGLARLALLIATFQLARLRPELSAHTYLWLLTAWAVMCAALTTRRGESDERERVGRYLGEKPQPVTDRETGIAPDT